MPVSACREFGSQADGANDKDGGQRSQRGDGDEATTHKSVPLRRGRETCVGRGRFFLHLWTFSLSLLSCASLLPTGLQPHRKCRGRTSCM